MTRTMSFWMSTWQTKQTSNAHGVAAVTAIQILGSQ